MSTTHTKNSIILDTVFVLEFVDSLIENYVYISNEAQIQGVMYEEKAFQI